MFFSIFRFQIKVYSVDKNGEKKIKTAKNQPETPDETGYKLLLSNGIDQIIVFVESVTSL